MVQRPPKSPLSPDTALFRCGFAGMRPAALVFNSRVGECLMGEDPPAFDILAWNADGTNLPARLHEQFLEIFSDNALVKPGAMRVLGTPVHLSRINSGVTNAG